MYKNLAIKLRKKTTDHFFKNKLKNCKKTRSFYK